MALKLYRNLETGEVIQSLKSKDPLMWEEIITAPESKFMVASNKGLRASKLKDATKILTERARNYSRDVDLDDNIRINRENGLDTQVNQSFLNEKGQKRRKIDDV